MIQRRVVLAVASALSLLPLASQADWVPNGNLLTPSGGETPSIATDASGGAFIAWQDAGGIGVQVQRIMPAGDIAPGWPRGGILARQFGQYPSRWGDSHPVLVPDENGGVYIVTLVWDQCTASCAVDPKGIYVQHVNGDGSVVAGWPADGIPVFIADNEATEVDRSTFPRATPDGHGGIIIAWQRYFLPPFRRCGCLVTGPILAQRLRPDGSRLWGDSGLLVCDAAGVQSLPEIVPDDAGGALIFWSDLPPAAHDGRILGQHVTAAGTFSWPANGIAVSGPYRLQQVPGPLVQYLAPPAVVSDGHQGAVVAWSGSRDADLDIYAARVTGEGVLPWKRDVPVCIVPGDQTDVLLTPEHAGAIVAWLDQRRAGAVEVRAQRLTESGKLEWSPDGAPVCTASGSRSLLTTSPDGSEGAYLAWTESRADGELFATRLSPHGTIARGWLVDGSPVSHRGEAIESLSSVQAGARSAMLTWWDAGSECWAMRLDSDGPAASTPSAAVSRDAIDSSANPIASAPRVELHASATGTVRFSLVNGMPASLELFDVAGRRIWAREVQSLGAGPHMLRLGDGAWMPVGVYVARLTQGSRVAITRIVVTH